MTTETYADAREAVHEQRIDGFGTVRVLPLDPRADLLRGSYGPVAADPVTVGVSVGYRFR